MSTTKQQTQKDVWKDVNAARLTAIAFGVYAGFFGFGHGIGEILQGNIITPSIRIYAFASPGLPFPFGQEPAMTIIPNYLFSGILTVIFGILIILWSTKYIKYKYWSIVLLILSIILLLVGGGYAPFTVLIIACISGIKINSKYKWCRKYLPTKFRQILSLLFPWAYISSLIWIIIEIALGYFFKVKYPFPGFILSYVIPVLMILSLLTVIMHDSLREAE
jgi:hypothetical protein